MRRLLRLLAATLVVAATTAGLIACGDDDDEPASSGGSTTTETQEKAEAPATADRDAPAAKAKGGGSASRPVLKGGGAQESLDAVSGVYSNLAAAVDNGVAAAKLQPRELLSKATDDDDLQSVCDLMTEEAKRQTVVYAERSSGLAGIDWNCENATALLLRRSRDAGKLKRRLSAEVVGINAKGDRATASLRFGRRITSVSLVKEDGEWKLAASPSAGGGR